MDEVIFEEFKGTGNMELVLDRKISEKRVYPAIDIDKSGTRKEDLLLSPANLQKMWALRRVLHDMTPLDSTRWILEKMEGTKDNKEFLDMMKG